MFLPYSGEIWIKSEDLKHCKVWSFLDQNKMKYGVATENCNSETASDDHTAYEQNGMRQASLKPA